MIFLFVSIQIILVIYLAFKYNRLKTLKIKAIEALKNIDAQLSKRATLVVELSKVVKAYDMHEAELLISISEVRNESNSSELRKVISRIEKNPKIKSAKLYKENQKQLTVVEGDIQSARLIYNSAATRYNEFLSILPNIFIAKAFGFKKALLFELTPL